MRQYALEGQCAVSFILPHDGSTVRLKGFPSSNGCFRARAFLSLPPSPHGQCLVFETKQEPLYQKNLSLFDLNPRKQNPSLWLSHLLIIVASEKRRRLLQLKLEGNLRDLLSYKSQFLLTVSDNDHGRSNPRSRVKTALCLQHEARIPHGIAD